MIANESDHTCRPNRCIGVDSHLQVVIVFKVDLLQALHLAQHPRHRCEAVALQANGLEVWQPSQTTRKTSICDPAKQIPSLQKGEQRQKLKLYSEVASCVDVCGGISHRGTSLHVTMLTESSGPQVLHKDWMKEPHVHTDNSVHSPKA